MQRTISILVVSITLLADSQAFAWGWKEAVQQALDKNPTIQIQRQSVEIASLQADNAQSLMYPTVSLNGGAREYQDQTRNFRHQIFMGPRLQYLLYQGGRVRSGIDRAQLQNTQADLNVQINSITINSRLRQAYAVALREKRYLDLSHRIEQQRQENVKFTKIRHESGLEYKWVYLSSSAKWQQAQLDVQQAEMNKRTALADLENITGKVPLESVLELNDQDFYADDVTYDLNQLLANMDQNPKIKIRESDVQEANVNIDIAKSDYYPRIGFQGDIGAINTERRELIPLTGSSFVPYWLVGASLTMPLYEGNRIRRGVAIARASLEQRKFDLEQAKLDLTTSLKKTYQAYEIAKQQVQVSQATVDATKDRSKVVANQYKSGLASFLDWESSQDGWVNAEIQLLNNVRDYQNARARLEEAMGMGLGD